MGAIPPEEEPLAVALYVEGEMTWRMAIGFYRADAGHDFAVRLDETGFAGDGDDIIAEQLHKFFQVSGGFVPRPKAILHVPDRILRSGKERLAPFE